MKQLAKLLFISILGGAIALGTYIFFFEQELVVVNDHPSLPAYQPASFHPSDAVNTDFTEAARKSVHAVVHVKNMAVRRSPFMGSRPGIALQGTGSGVIISPDGYIVTNNHVIQNASRIQVTLNNNQNFMADVIGTDPKTDIALIKIDATELAYLPFGDSDTAEVGEWVLAVGNPYNLTSTVTAGIISAKSRDLGMNNDVSSYLQTDAAVNPGNSGGALVNVRGELIGINTAITSQTGSYIGYAFAVPSNNARKIVEDIMEFGDVQQGILGIRGADVSDLPQDMGIDVSQGVYVSEVEQGTGAASAGIRQGDILREIDNIQIRKFADLTGYIGSKRPDDVVTLRLLRDGDDQTVEVQLSKQEIYQIAAIGLEVTNASASDLRKVGAQQGVRITRGTTPQMQSEQLQGTIISEIDNNPVRNVNQVKEIMINRNPADPISVTFVSANGQEQTYIWR